MSSDEDSDGNLKGFVVGSSDEDSEDGESTEEGDEDEKESDEDEVENNEKNRPRRRLRKGGAGEPADGGERRAAVQACGSSK